MSQERKKEIAEKLKVALKNSGIKYSLSVQHHSTLVMTITSGPIDFFADMVPGREWIDNPQGYVEERRECGWIDVNPYWWHEHFTGKSKELFAKIFPILNNGNHDNSDIMTDYFDVGWYLSVKVGKSDKPYILTAG